MHLCFDRINVVTLLYYLVIFFIANREFRILKMFGDKRGKYTSLITFIEEILPVTDVIPSFTIFWFIFDFLKIGKEKDYINKITPI